MANNILTTGRRTTGLTCYGRIFADDGTVRDVVAGAWDTFTDADVGDYDVAATEIGTASGQYAMTFPALAAGNYSVDIFERAGANPEITDEPFWHFDVAWDGSAFVVGETMRGTDSAALAATALTDATWTDARAGYLDELAAANLPTDVAAVKAETALIVEDTGTTLVAILNNGTYGLAALNDDLDALISALADVPTVAEFEARTTLTASYSTFDPTTDDVILADSALHGGSSMVLTMDRVVISSGANSGIAITTTSGIGIDLQSGTGIPFSAYSTGNSAATFYGTSAAAAAIDIVNYGAGEAMRLDFGTGKIEGLIEGIEGTIQTLDALDTAQDTKHDATPAAVLAALGTGSWITAAALVSTGLDAVVLPTDILTAAAVKADAVTKIQSGLSTHDAAAVLTALGTGSWISAASLAADQSGVTIGTVTLVTTTTTNTDMRGTDNAAIADTVEGFFQVALRKDAAIATDRAAELALINADEGSGAGGYVSTTDSTQSIYDGMVSHAATMAAGFVSIGGTITGSHAATDALILDVPTVAEFEARTLPTAEYAPAAILTTQLTEAYAAKGVVPTLAELMFEIRSHHVEKGVIDTTLTTKKIDGSTTAATHTLDDATSPTSITRAT